MIWIFECFFGRWITQLVKPFGEIVVLCQRHSITKRARGFAIYPGGSRIEIDASVAEEHMNNYGEFDR